MQRFSVLYAVVLAFGAEHHAEADAYDDDRPHIVTECETFYEAVGHEERTDGYWYEPLKIAEAASCS